MLLTMSGCVIQKILPLGCLSRSTAALSLLFSMVCEFGSKMKHLRADPTRLLALFAVDTAQAAADEGKQMR